MLRRGAPMDEDGTLVDAFDDRGAPGGIRVGDQEIDEVLKFQGFPNVWTQPITPGSPAPHSIIMLSVAYAMTGGVILQWWLGYNFSVAVWVGYIALYGVVVHTGVVMVVYLHESLDRRLRSGKGITEDDVQQATMEGYVGYGYVRN